MTNMNKRSMLAMILAVFIGLVCALGMCVQRNAIENESTTVEQAMDYDAIVVMARNDGYDLDTALQMCRDAGVTSFTIYDTTLNKLTQRGELSLVTKLGADLYYPQFGITDKSYDYYLIGKPQGQTDLYFDEVVSDLKTRLGDDKVKIMSHGPYRIAGIQGVMPGLGDVNLGILSADAKTISDHGFHVILRPTNYSNPTKEQVAHFFDRVDQIKNVSGIMFVGKEVLGYTPVNAERKTMLDYTADNLNDRDIPFYMIESVNQLQYNQQDGMYDLAGLVHYRTARHGSIKASRGHVPSTYIFNNDQIALFQSGGNYILLSVIDVKYGDFIHLNRIVRLLQEYKFLILYFCRCLLRNNKSVFHVVRDDEITHTATSQQIGRASCRERV